MPNTNYDPLTPSKKKEGFKRLKIGDRSGIAPLREEMERSFFKTPHKNPDPSASTQGTPYKSYSTYSSSAAKTGDPRPLKDPMFQNAVLQDILQFLSISPSGNRIETTSLSDLRKIQKNQFDAIVWIFFEDFADSSVLKDSAKFSSLILAILSLTKYPVKVNKTSLATPGAPHNLSVTVGIFHWFLSLHKYTETMEETFTLNDTESIIDERFSDLIMKKFCKSLGESCINEEDVRANIRSLRKPLDLSAEKQKINDRLEEISKETKVLKKTLKGIQRSKEEINKELANIQHENTSLKEEATELSQKAKSIEETLHKEKEVFKKEEEETVGLEEYKRELEDKSGIHFSEESELKYDPLASNYFQIKEDMGEKEILDVVYGILSDISIQMENFRKEKEEKKVLKEKLRELYTGVDKMVEDLNKTLESYEEEFFMLENGQEKEHFYQSSRFNINENKCNPGTEKKDDIGFLSKMEGVLQGLKNLKVFFKTNSIEKEKFGEVKNNHQKRNAAGLGGKRVSLVGLFDTLEDEGEGNMDLSRLKIEFLVEKDIREELGAEIYNEKQKILFILEKAENRIKEYNESVEKTSEAVKSRSRDLEKIKEELKAVEADKESWANKDNRDIENRIKSLEQEIKKEKDNLETEAKENEKLKDKFERMKAEIEDFKEKLPYIKQEKEVEIVDFMEALCKKWKKLGKLIENKFEQYKILEMKFNFPESK